MHGDMIAWAESDYSIYYWDGSSTHKVNGMTGDYVVCHNGQIAARSNYFFWDMIQFWNGNSVTNVKIMSTTDAAQFDLYNGAILYYEPGDATLCRWKNGNTTVLRTGIAGCNSVALYESTYAWRYGTVYFFDGAQTRPASGGYGANLDLYDGQIVSNRYWKDDISGESGYALDFWQKTGWRTIDNDNSTASVCEGCVAYAKRDGTVRNDYEIYFWDGSTVTQVTDNQVDDTYPCLYINSPAQIAWITGGGEGICLAVQVVPEPGACLLLAFGLAAAGYGRRRRITGG